MLRNIGSNWVLTLVTIAATYVLTPFTIHTLGRDGYGTWTLITALTGYMSLLALGVPMACVRYLAEHVAEGDARKMNETIGSCGSLYVLLLGAGARLSFETDALVIGGVLGVGAIPFYAVANSLVVYLMDFTIAIAAVVSPMATKLNTEGKRPQLIEIFLKWSKISLS